MSCETPKKLIEVALPLDAINAASAREKSIRHGHPSTLHLWWARRPLAACRAVLFASLVDDPTAHPDRFPTAAEQETERRRLFGLIERLVQWENSNDAALLAEVRMAIRDSAPKDPTTGEPTLPHVLDPFAGGGSIPLEAQRLGLEARASDLNPVAVLINKAMIEIPPLFANLPPVHPDTPAAALHAPWQGAHGLAADVRAYGQWMRDEAARRIGHLYPAATLPDGSQATVIAWLWARTVRCPNPACGAQMPLLNSFVLSAKPGKQTWLDPQPDPAAKRVRFAIRSGDGTPPEPPKQGRGAKFRCLCCAMSPESDYIKTEGRAGRIGAQLTAIVVDGPHGRVYLPATSEHERIAASATPAWHPEAEIGGDRRSMFTPLYGLTHFHHLFTPRQLVALTTLCDLVNEARERIATDARSARHLDPSDQRGLDAGGRGPRAYAEAVSVYLAFAVDRLSDRSSTICSWDLSRESTRNTFARQAIPMTWDFAEANPLSSSTGNFTGALDWIVKVLQELPRNPAPLRHAFPPVKRLDATQSLNGLQPPLVISTDPPYYDNIGYADLADYFYVWLRRSMQHVYPSHFRFSLSPDKERELIVAPHRHGGDKTRAKAFFEDHLRTVFGLMYDKATDTKREGTSNESAGVSNEHTPSSFLAPDSSFLSSLYDQASHDYPCTIYYAFKQEESDHGGSASTGWETMLEALVRGREGGRGFVVTGTWPIRTELANRSTGQNTNSLASSIVLVCRPRPQDAPILSRREFVPLLRRELAQALVLLQQGNVAPVDLAQALIGPGMAVYSRYRAVMEADGTPVRVRTALQLITGYRDEWMSAHIQDVDITSLMNATQAELIKLAQRIDVTPYRIMCAYHYTRLLSRPREARPYAQLGARLTNEALGVRMAIDIQGNVLYRTNERINDTLPHQR